MYEYLFLYIDPGTGSMLFSVFIGVVTASYFLLKAAWIKIKFFFTKREVKNGDTKKHGIVIYSEGSQYWNVFYPVLKELERRKICSTYYTSDQKDPVFEQEWKFINAEFIGEGNKAFMRLNFLEAKICLMTTPGLEVYQLKRSKGVDFYVHVLHSVDDATSYRLFGIDYFDAVLLSGEYQKKAIRELESKRSLPAKELVVVGCSYLDFAREKISLIEKKKNDRITVLVSPSWGKSALLSKYGKKLLDPLVKENFNIIIRPHPQSKKSEQKILEYLQAEYCGYKNVEWDFERDNLSALVRSDIMISDFSGIIFDYAFLLNKPFLYALQDFNAEIYDSSDLEEEPWKFKAIKKMGTELTESMFSSIGTVVYSLVNDEALSIKRQEEKNIAWNYEGESSARIVDFLIETSKNVNF